VSLERRIPVGHTPPGRGLIGLLRASTAPDATAADLLAWLRTPGFVLAPGAVDAFEAELLREGVRSVAEARARWEAARPAFILRELDEVAAAAREGGAALCARLVRTLDRQRAAGPPRDPDRAPSLADTMDARVSGQLASALESLALLAAGDADLIPDPDGLARVLADVEVRVGEPPGSDRVVVADPLALRARRVRALFLCDLQDGVFPAAPRPDALLGDSERRAINTASGLGLRLSGPQDAAGRERHLFYAAVSRPEGLLALSWHAADDRGNPAVPSPFLDEVIDLLPEGALDRVVTRPLGAAGHDGPFAATAREEELAVAARSPGHRPEPIGRLTDPGVLAELAAREVWSASSLETWLACPVRWFVDRLLRPEDLLPEPEPLGRGRLAHAVLEHVFRALRQSRRGPLGPDRRAEARGLVHEALAVVGPTIRLSTDPGRDRIARRRVEADLLALVDHLAEAGWSYVPQEFELAFGGAKDERPAVELAPGVKLSGRIDRVDVDPGGSRGAVVDYKGTTAYGAGEWLSDGRIQVALYAAALPALLDVEPVAGVYQPTSKPRDLRARGAERADAGADVTTAKGDKLDPDDFASLLEDAVALAARAVEEIRAGRLEPRPGTCGFRGDGCQYPSICRCEA
jgi:RecB family exonuclease